MTRTPGKSVATSLWKQADIELRTTFPEADNLLRSWVRLYVDGAGASFSLGAETFLSRGVPEDDAPPGRNAINGFLENTEHRFQSGGLSRLAHALQQAEPRRKDFLGESFRDVAAGALELGTWIKDCVARRRAERQEAGEDKGAAAALARIVQLHDHDPAMRRHFMYADHEAQQSHFLVYRYSTIGDHVAKSILTVQAPLDPEGHWRFQNLFRGKREADGSCGGPRAP